MFVKISYGLARWLYLIWSLYLLSGAYVYASGEDSGRLPISVEVGVLGPRKSPGLGIVFVNISNLGTRSVDCLELSLEDSNSLLTTKSLASLNPGQSQFVRFSIPACEVSELALRVGYRQNGVEQSLVKVFKLGAPESEHGMSWETIIPAIAGGGLTLVGVLVASVFASRRETAKANFEWGKFLFERYGECYREFIGGLTGTLNGGQIREYFKRLNDSAFVPNYLKREVDEACTKLECGGEAEDKIAARDALLHEFEEFIKKPWASRDWAGG